MIVVQLAKNASHLQDPPMDLNVSQLNGRHNTSYFFNTNFSFPSHIHISKVFYALKVFRLGRKSSSNGRTQTDTKFHAGNLKERDHLVEVSIDVIILKWILKTYGISMWTGFIWFKKRSTAGSC
jgi:hypothetical protein